MTKWVRNYQGGSEMVTSNFTVDVQDVLKAVEVSEPQGFSVSWEFPGYISIRKSDDSVQIAFGESLEDDNRYTWSAINAEGYEIGCGSFEDKGSVQAIVVELWNQTAELVAL